MWPSDGGGAPAESERAELSVGMTPLDSATSVLRGVTTAVLDALLPPRCAACGEPVDRPRTLCLACWSRLSFIARPLCAICGNPFTPAPWAPTRAVPR